jgi:low temperature requirement protein LtrA
VRAKHLVLYAIAARADASLWLVVRNLAPGMVGSAGLILIAGLEDGSAQAALWVVAIVVEVAFPLIRGVENWRVHPGHFAERHGEFVIIALGESIVAAGVGIGTQDLDAGLITAAVLGVVTAAGLWWSYFDIGVHVAARILRGKEGGDRARMARDSYTYIHLPMIAGIVLYALGVKKTLAHVGEPLHVVPAVALCGGLALYQFGQVAFRLRNVRTLSVRRVVAMLTLLALIPAAHHVDAWVSLAITTAFVWAVIIYEVIRYRSSRQAWIHPEEVAA